MPVKIFFCYAHEDEPLLNKLKLHLRPLQRQGLIDVWHDRDISAGTEWESEIRQHLNSAQIILLLISPDFMDSDYCYGTEMQRAMERHERGEARVIPVILRPVYWQVASLPKLQALPTDAKPVKSWPDQDEAFFNVVGGISKVLEELSFPQQQPSAWSASASQEASPWGQQDPYQPQQAEQAYEEIRPHLSVSPSVASPPSQPSQPAIPEIIPPSQRLTVPEPLPEPPMTGERSDAVGARFIAPAGRGGATAHEEVAPILAPTARLADIGVTSIPTRPPNRSSQPDKTASPFGWPDHPHKTTPLPFTTSDQWRPRRARGQHKNIVFPIILFLAAAVLLTMSGVFAFQLLALPTVSIHFRPQIHLVSQIFQITASTSVTGVDVGSRSIPARVLRGSSTSSQTGPTTCPASGACQHVVSPSDVSTLERQLYINLKSKISQDVQQQLPPGTTQIGSIQYDPQPTEMVNPPEGSTSKTVTVTVTERWSISYFLNRDAQTLARQFLLRQMSTYGANYVPIDSTIRVGQPVVTVSDYGNATINVPAAGYIEYQFPQSQLVYIQNQIKGKTVSSARNFIAIQTGIDSKTISIRFRSAGRDEIPNNGDVLPGDPQRITLTTDPVSLPPVQLPSVTPTSTPSTPPFLPPGDCNSPPCP